ncbi:MAG: mycofactocin biosynthesis chaperone MftB [Microthrixaceae bacterium]|nr:mycofactocin biosynthesis chaperone MftB [Microthrixaceae bacterium]
MDLDTPYRLDPQVSLRPEEFGALAYHFGNRKLSFLKHPDLLRVLEQLDTEPSLGAAPESAGISPRRWSSFLKALETLGIVGDDSCPYLRPWSPRSHRLRHARWWSTSRRASPRRSA